MSDNKEDYPLPVPWLNSKEHQLEFFAIPGEFNLYRSTSFQSGRVYGMDVTSGAAVAALLFDMFDLDNKKKPIDEESNKTNMQPEESKSKSTGLRVLDLCCAPG